MPPIFGPPSTQNWSVPHPLPITAPRTPPASGIPEPSVAVCGCRRPGRTPRWKPASEPYPLRSAHSSFTVLISRSTCPFSPPPRGREAAPRTFLSPTKDPSARGKIPSARLRLLVLAGQGAVWDAGVIRHKLRLCPAMWVAFGCKRKSVCRVLVKLPPSQWRAEAFRAAMVRPAGVEPAA